MNDMSAMTERDENIAAALQAFKAADSLLADAGFNEDSSARNRLSIIASMLRGERFNPDWSQTEAMKESLREHMEMLSVANNLLRRLRELKSTWVGEEENNLRRDLNSYLEKVQ